MCNNGASNSNPRRLAVLAACQPQPAALTDAQKTALADSAKAIVQTMVANANKLDFGVYFQAIDAIVLGPDAVAITFPFRFSFKPKGRAEYQGQGIWTELLQRRNGKWQIVQTHESWVNAEQGMAAMMGPPAKSVMKKK